MTDELQQQIARRGLCDTAMHVLSTLAQADRALTCEALTRRLGVAFSSDVTQLWLDELKRSGHVTATYHAMTDEHTWRLTQHGYAAV